MSSPATELPPEWAATTILRHFANPYSNEALAEPRQDIIDLGPVDMSGLPQAENGDTTSIIKHAGQDFDPTSGDPEYRAAHRLFFSAARLILGQDMPAAAVHFRHASSPLPAAGMHTLGVPHIDGSFPQAGLSKPMLKLVGLAVNAAPTKVVQGGYARKDFEGLPMGLDGEIIEYTYRPPDRGAIRSAEEIVTGRLLLLGPAVVHFAQGAERTIPMRHFMRWSLFL